MIRKSSFAGCNRRFTTSAGSGLIVGLVVIWLGIAGSASGRAQTAPADDEQSCIGYDCPEGADQTGEEGGNAGQGYGVNQAASAAAEDAPNDNLSNQAAPPANWANQNYANPAWQNQTWQNQAYPNQPCPDQAYPSATYPEQAWPDQNGQNRAWPIPCYGSAYPNGSRQNPRPGAETGTLPPYLYRTPPPPTEFQLFVESSVGRRLPIYGYNLFDRVLSTFAPVDRIPVTDDYVIGPGDEILVRAWGQVDLNLRLAVDRSGEVFLPKVGSLPVAGLKYHELLGFFRSAIGRVFRNFDLTVTLGQLRSIQVFVVGQARRPGSYTISSLATLVNALFASGGPSETGSMRHIQLKRNDTVVADFDLYDLLLRGDKSKDARLLPGDVIYIPPAGPLVALAGSVNVPAIYELREETNLKTAIAMAGGLATTADGEKAVVERIENHATRRIEEFPLKNAKLAGSGVAYSDTKNQPPQGAASASEGSQDWARVLQDGDVVRILSLSPRFENAVTLRGNVAHPGRVPWHSGMRLREVIPNQEALITRNYWREANAATSSSLQSERQFGRPPAPSNAAKNGPGNPSNNFPNNTSGNPSGGMSGNLSNNLSGNDSSAGAAPEAGAAELRNRIAREAPEINWDYAVVQRLNPEDLTTRLIPFNLGKLVLDRDEQNNLALEPGDIVTIFSQRDLAVPLEKRSKFVRLEGEFRAAGVYRAEAGETLRHLVARAGGLTGSAYLYGAEFTRESVRQEQQKGLEQLIENLEQGILRNALAPGGLTPDEVADQREKLEMQQQLVAKLRAVRATGRVVLDLKPDSSSPADLPDMPVEDGDRFVVPYRPSTIAMLGAVYNKNSFLYRPKERVGDYLRQAGGPTRDADARRMFILRADGSVVSSQSVHGLWNGGLAELRLMPGDAIVVPERLSQGAFLRGLRDWSQVFSQFALGAAAIRVIQ